MAKKKMKKDAHFGDVLLAAFYPAFAVVCLIVAVGIAGKFGINRLFMLSGGGGALLRGAEHLITVPAEPEGYIPWYNLGNAAAARGEYAAAEQDYAKALEYSPANGRECPIRINYALAVLGEVSDEDYQAALHGDAEKKASVVQHLRNARGILTEQGCAGASDDSGHSAKAEQLKKEIDEYLKKLGEDPEQNQDKSSSGENQDQQQSSGGENDESQSSGNDRKSSREQRLQEELNQQKSDARRQREDEQEQYRSWGQAPEESGGADGSGGSGDSGSYTGRQW
jgi:tetratricopeptide (TPR) repeat protein